MLYIVNSVSNIKEHHNAYEMIPIKGGTRYIIFDDQLGIILKVLRGNSIISFLQRDLNNGQSFRYANFNGDMNYPCFSNWGILELLEHSRMENIMRVDINTLAIAENYTNIDFHMLSVANGMKRFLKIHNWYFEFRWQNMGGVGNLLLSNMLIKFNMSDLEMYAINMMGSRPVRMDLGLYFCDVRFIDNNTISMLPRVVNQLNYYGLRDGLKCLCNKESVLTLNISTGVLQLVDKNGKIKCIHGIPEELIIKEIVFNSQ